MSVKLTEFHDKMHNVMQDKSILGYFKPHNLHNALFLQVQKVYLAQVNLTYRSSWLA